MVAKKTAASKTTAAKTTAAKRTATKQSVAKKVAEEAAPAVAATVPTSAADPSGLQPEDSKSPESIAEDILRGSKRWGTGRDRVALLKAAGHDPEEVRKAVNRLRRRSS